MRTSQPRKSMSQRAMTCLALAYMVPTLAMVFVARETQADWALELAPVLMMPVYAAGLLIIAGFWLAILAPLPLQWLRTGFQRRRSRLYTREGRRRAVYRV